MSDNDPFAEPDDTDKTVIRPNPGGRRTSSAPQEPPAAPASAARSGVHSEYCMSIDRSAVLARSTGRSRSALVACCMER